MNTMTFQGFPKEGLKFLANLKRNNKREWFTKHKPLYQETVEAPAKAFAFEMEELLATLTKRPMSGKVFRIYRDVRFSKDKTPYNTHIHMSFFCADGNTRLCLKTPSGFERLIFLLAASGCIDDRTNIACFAVFARQKNARSRAGRRSFQTKPSECGAQPAFHFGLEPKKLTLGIGSFGFPKDVLDAYREAVDNNTSGRKLVTLLKNYPESKGFHLQEPELKRVPAGYDKDHPRAELLRRKGLVLWHEQTPDETIHSPKSARGSCLNNTRP